MPTKISSASISKKRIREGESATNATKANKADVPAPSKKTTLTSAPLKASIVSRSSKTSDRPSKRSIGAREKHLSPSIDSDEETELAKPPRKGPPSDKHDTIVANNEKARPPRLPIKPTHDRISATRKATKNLKASSRAHESTKEPKGIKAKQVQVPLAPSSDSEAVSEDAGGNEEGSEQERVSEAVPVTTKSLKTSKPLNFADGLTQKSKRGLKVKKETLAPMPKSPVAFEHEHDSEGGFGDDSGEGLDLDSAQTTKKTLDATRSPEGANTATMRLKKSDRAKQAPSPPVLEPTENAAETEEDAEDLHLHGFSTDEDSSDEENAVQNDTPALDMSRLPTIAKDDATVKRKLDQAKRRPAEDRGVLFISRIPHGFYEDQMRSYFSQFGTVTRIRLSRNKKTGRSKHYGYIEFDSSSVAQIVADTMDNYLLLGHILRCKVIPKDQVHSELWVGANRKWKTVPRDRLTRVKHNKPRTEEQQARADKRLLKRQNERKRKLAEAGIDYSFDVVGYKRTKAAAM